MSEGTKEDFCLHVKKVLHPPARGGGGEEGAVYETPLFLKDQMFGGNLGRKAEPVLILMTHCLFKALKKK
jgi:hypothetical protein